MKKYKLVDEGRKDDLKRVVALRDFGNVKKGDKGGLIQSEDNLSHRGNAWVYGNARVFGNASVLEGAQVFGNAWVFGDAWVTGNARVYDNALVFGNAYVYGKARVFGNAKVSDNARVYDDAWVFGDARVYGHSELKKGCETKTSIFLTVALPWNITISETHSKIGCQCKPHDKWLNMPPTPIIDMISDDLEIDTASAAKIYNTYRPVIEALIKIRQNENKSS